MMPDLFFGLIIKQEIMGIRLFGSSSSYDCSCNNQSYESPNINPNPSNFNIIGAKEIGNYLVAEIEYHDCKNYEGRKILVFENLSIKKLKEFKHIDPHFSNSDKYKSPIARFEPTVQGWDNACVFCKYKNI
jgi:hypothetical protein